MSEVKTHWKKLTNPDYIGAYSLEPGKDLVVVIEKVVRQMVTGADGKKEECTVAHLKGQKPMILNNTNCKTISKVYGSSFIEDWAGKAITLYVEKVKAFGEWVEALRIRSVAPELKKPELTPDHQKWAGAIKSLKAGNTTIEKIKTAFSISEENESNLIAATHE